MRWSLHFVACVFFFKAIIVTSVKSFGHSLVSYSYTVRNLNSLSRPSKTQVLGRCTAGIAGSIDVPFAIVLSHGTGRFLVQGNTIECVFLTECNQVQQEPSTPTMNR